MAQIDPIGDTYVLGYSVALGDYRYKAFISYSQK